MKRPTRSQFLGLACEEHGDWFGKYNKTLLLEGLHEFFSQENIRDDFYLMDGVPMEPDSPSEEAIHAIDAILKTWHTKKES